MIKSEKPVLLKPNTLTRYPRTVATGGTNRRYAGENPKPGLPLVYILPKRAEKVSIKIFDVEGKTISDTKLPGLAGIHKQTWDVSSNGRPVPSGTYRVVLQVDDKEYSKLLKIVGDAAAGPRFGGGEEDEDEDREEENEMEKDKDK